jgi:hypothetical protein
MSSIYCVLQGIDSTEEAILAELGDSAHEEQPTKGSQSQNMNHGFAPITAQIT